MSRILKRLVATLCVAFNKEDLDTRTDVAALQTIQHPSVIQSSITRHWHPEGTCLKIHSRSETIVLLYSRFGTCTHGRHDGGTLVATYLAYSEVLQFKEETLLIRRL
jgi:hypothetical protein